MEAQNQSIEFENLLFKLLMLNDTYWCYRIGLDRKHCPTPLLPKHHPDPDTLFLKIAVQGIKLPYNKQCPLRGPALS